ncbi:MAG TPA: putative Ig domain-containing protein [Rugosimonospora sp.]|nr:putative Ig domain-containing protein [Rugosimonospora sp.]
MPIAVHPVTPTQYMEPSTPLQNRLLFHAPNGSYYYVTGAEVGANALTESTFNLWILKSADGGVTWTRIVNYAPPTYLSYEVLAAALAGAKIWITVNLSSTGGHTPGTAIYSLDTAAADTFTTGYPASAITSNPAGLAILADGTPLLLTLASVSRFNGVTWDAPVSLSASPYTGTKLKSVTWDANRVYLFVTGVLTALARIGCLTIDATTLTPGTWQTVYNFTAPPFLAEVETGAASGGNVALAIKMTISGHDELHVICGSGADSGSLALADRLVISETGLPADYVLSPFTLLDWYDASLVDVGGTLYCFYVVSKPLNYDATDQGFLYYATSTACGAWSAPTLAYTTTLGVDALTPYPVAVSSASWAAIQGTVDPQLFTGITPGAKYASLSVYLLVAAIPLAISCNNPQAGTVGAAYSHTLTITGGTAPYVVSLVSGSLPPNLTLSMSGTIAGTPIANGSWTFVVRAVDGASTIAQVTCSIAIGDCQAGDIGGPG